MVASILIFISWGNRQQKIPKEEEKKRKVLKGKCDTNAMELYEKFHLVVFHIGLKFNGRSS